jgi:hypothetical protein
VLGQPAQGGVCYTYRLGSGVQKGCFEFGCSGGDFVLLLADCVVPS